MSIQGWYYLHTNGSLIYKRELGGTAADIRESDLALALEYWAHRMQRYKNRHPVWVQNARATLAKLRGEA